jgi:hypothetical protein
MKAVTQTYRDGMMALMALGRFARGLAIGAAISALASCTDGQGRPADAESSTPSTPDLSELSPTPTVTSYTTFLMALSDEGLAVEGLDGPGLKRLLGGTGHRLDVNGSMYVHEYPTASAVAEFQHGVRDNGTTIPAPEGNGVILVEWATPRMYSHGDMLVLYFGENDKTLAALRDVLGRPFARGTSSVADRSAPG